MKYSITLKVNSIERIREEILEELNDLMEYYNDEIIAIEVRND